MLAVIPFVLWSVGGGVTGLYILDSAFAAEAAQKYSGDREPPIPPVGPQPQPEGQHSVQDGQPALDTLKAVGSTVFGDIAYLATAPLRMDLKSGLITAGVVGVVGGVMAFDSNIQRWVQNHRTETGNEVFNDIKVIGDVMLPMNAGLAIGGFMFRKCEEGNKLFQTSLVSLESVGLASAITSLTKFAVGRNRPSDDPQGNSYDPFQRFDQSFPSGHATQMFAMAAVFAEQYSAPVQVVLYTIATAVSAERVYDDHHFTSDVLAGAAIGYVVGKALALQHTYGDKGISFMPLEVSGGGGVTLQYRF